MSIRRELMYAFAAVIFLTIMLVQAIAFFVTRATFFIYTSEEMQQEANHIAYVLSVEFTKKQRWDAIDFENYFDLFWPEDGDFLQSPEYATEEENITNAQPIDSSQEADFVDMHDNEPLEHIVVTDLQGDILFDNLARLYEYQPQQQPKGIRALITDFAKQTGVGYVYFNSNEQLQKKETYDFLLFTFSITAAGGLLTLVVSLVVSFYLAKKITEPMSLLTKESERLLKEYDTQCDYPETSNEVEALKYAYNQLVETIKTQKYLRQRLLSDLSHEIHTPLSVIQLEAKGLKDGFQTPDEASEHISGEISKLKNLIEDLNWIAETDAGKVPLRVVSFNLVSTLRDELMRWTSTLKSQNKTINFDPMDVGSEWLVKADRLRLMQALNNVISNAIKYSQAGSLIQVVIDSSADYFFIRVSDNGIGISKENLPHVMSRFYRVEESRNRQTEGRGIGLSIVRSIIEAHQGKVVISSEGLGNGCTVEFRLPLSMVVRKV